MKKVDLIIPILFAVFTLFSCQEEPLPIEDPEDDFIEIGNLLKPDGKRVVASVDELWVYMEMGGTQSTQPLELGFCQGNTYYTSLPAKCRSVDGRLLKVGERPRKITLLDESDRGE